MVTVDPQVLVGAAGLVLDTAQDVNVAWQDARTSHTGMGSAAAGRAAGSTPAGALLVSEHVACSEAATTSFETLAGVLEYAAEGIYACAFGYSTADDEAAEGFEDS